MAFDRLNLDVFYQLPKVYYNFAHYQVLIQILFGEYNWLEIDPCPSM